MVRILAAGQYLADRPGLQPLFLALAPDWLLHLLWRIHGDFILKCEHVERGAEPFLVLQAEHRRRGRILWRARILLCRECARALP